MNEENKVEEVKVKRNIKPIVKKALIGLGTILGAAVLYKLATGNKSDSCEGGMPVTTDSAIERSDEEQSEVVE